jgi:hypothetical protein
MCRQGVIDDIGHVEKRSCEPGLKRLLLIRGPLVITDGPTKALRTVLMGAQDSVCNRMMVDDACCMGGCT